MTRDTRRDYPFDSEPPNGAEGLSADQKELLLLLWIVESVNATAAALSDPSSAQSRGQPVFLANVVDRTRSQLLRAKPSWPRTTLLEALHDIDLVPEFDSNLIDRLCKWLSTVLLRGLDSAQPDQRTLPIVRRWTVHWRGLEDLNGSQLDSEGRVDARAVRVVLADEALDPVAVLLDYLYTALSMRATLVEHEFQRFLRRCFGLSYRRHYVLLANLCSRLNYLYYDRASFSAHVAQAARTPIVSVAALLEVMRQNLRATVAPLDRARSTELLRDEASCALGFFFAFRFCQMFRVQYRLPDLTSQAREQVDDATTLRKPSLEATASLLQPLQYSMLRSRIFGSLSGIEGLNEIFGGGLLPGVELGRVWVVSGQAGGGKTSLALNLAADMAARKHLVIYFSFEESYNNIGDRAVMFRLYQADRFQVDAAGDDLEAHIANAYADEHERGLLLYYRESHFDLAQTLRNIREIVGKRAPRWARSTAVIIDSIDALEPGGMAGDENESRYARRTLLRQLFRQLEEANYWALVLTERGNPELPTLQHLADTYIEVGSDDATGGRWLQIHKCRLQDFMPGKHGYQLRDGKSASLVPNLSAIQRIVRRRVPATLSESRVLPLPEALWPAVPTPVVREKSATLIWGNRGSGKTPFWLNLVTEQSRRTPPDEGKLLPDVQRLRAELPQWAKDPAGALVVVSFRTPTQRFLQALRARRFLNNRWNLCRRREHRWYQPGPELTAAHVIRDLRRMIAQARIDGTPIERIVFEEIDAIEALLPNLAHEPAFWPTVFGLLAAEAITTFYVLSNEADHEPAFSERFVAGMDYAFRFWHPPLPLTAAPADAASADLPLELAYLKMYKHPGPQTQLSDRAMRIRVALDGRVELARAEAPI